MHACNISMHAICSPKILHLNIVFISPREDLISPRKICETMVEQPLWGKQVYYGQYIIGEQYLFSRSMPELLFLQRRIVSYKMILIL